MIPICKQTAAHTTGFLWAGDLAVPRGIAVCFSQVRPGLGLSASASCDHHLVVRRQAGLCTPDRHGPFNQLPRHAEPYEGAETHRRAQRCAASQFDLLSIIVMSLRIVGNNTGFVADLADVARAIAVHRIAPVIDRVLGIADTTAA